MNHIPVTFAIITSGADQARLAECVASVERLAIPNHEVLIVGGQHCEVSGPAVRHIPFEEPEGKAGWITRKKNIATQQARHEVVVYYHDYHLFDSDWYEQLRAFGTDWDICQHRILCNDGTRFFGWAIWDHPSLPRYFNVPYERHDLVPHMYISGGYWVAKREVMLEAPLDESLLWGQAEDVEWSLRVRDRYRIRANGRCVVRHNKAHAGRDFCRRMAMLEPAFESLLAGRAMLVARAA
jgi:hypothetical protein